MDGLLIKSLLQNELLRDSFFTKVDDIYVFDKVNFTWVLESKEFLPDSYTLYKNKIGLVDNQNNLISQKQDVTLVWPYKDCVLEGGQTKEDQKREEIFYNETLAPDEVNRLLAPKVLGNAKRYTADGVEEDIDFQDDDNLIIKGNNLLGVNSLNKVFHGKVKLITIDSPYFFRKTKTSDAFKYNSNFKLSTWLTFMKNRIESSYELLSEDGVLMVMVGEEGAHYLQVLLDQIFNVDNYPDRFKGKISWRKSDNQSNTGDFANVVDYILIYVKNELTKLNKLPLTEKAQANYSYEDQRGRFRREVLQHISRGKHRYKITTPSGNVLEGPWMITEEEFNKRQEEGGIYWPEKGYETPYGKIYLSDSLNKGQVTSDFWGVEYGTNQRGADEMKNLFGDRAFDFPKSERVMMNMISLGSNEGDLVLDFFMGSGTTQAVAHKMNRQYIGIEQMNYIEDISVERLRKVVSGEQGGISKDVNWQGGGSFVYCELLEDNQALINEIQDATDSNTVKFVLAKATDNGKIVPFVLPDDLKKTEEEFDELSLEEQKTLVLELLDKNKLYVNLSDLDDEDDNVNEADKAFTKSFYGLN